MPYQYKENSFIARPVQVPFVVDMGEAYRISVSPLYPYDFQGNILFPTPQASTRVLILWLRPSILLVMLTTVVVRSGSETHPDGCGARVSHLTHLLKLYRQCLLNTFPNPILCTL